MKVGDAIKAGRLSKRMSQQDLADAIGMSQGYISDLEKNRRPLNHDVRSRLIAIIGELPEAESERLSKPKTRVATDGVTKPAKSQPDENVGRMYFASPSDFDVVVPRLRQNVHAGDAMETIDDTAELVNVTKLYKGTLVIDITGDSMREAGIEPGDKVIIKLDQRARNGDIVLALLNGKHTLKYYDMTDEGLCLLPANDDYASIYVQPDDDVRIQGVFVEVIRADRKGYYAKRKERERKHKRKG